MLNNAPTPFALHNRPADERPTTQRPKTTKKNIESINILIAIILVLVMIITISVNGSVLVYSTYFSSHLSFVLLHPEMRPLCGASSVTVLINNYFED